MKTYNEIYPAEGWADKILKYLRKVADEKPNMYAKTKKRYEDLAHSLLTSVGLIVSILEEDSLVPRTNNEFDELSSPADVSLSRQLDELNRRFRQAEQFSSPSLHHNADTVHQNSVITATKFIATVEYFDKIFKESCGYNFGYSEVNECAKCLYRWFHTRFNPSIRDPEFRFNVQYLPTWIGNFIILYGKYHHARKNSQFVTMINTWCDKVDSGQNHIYAIPAEIHQLDKQIEPADYTIDAVIIHDLLVNGYLYKLSDATVDMVVHYDPNVVVTVVKDRNPAVRPKMLTRISRRQEFIREIGLTPVGGIDVDE